MESLEGIGDVAMRPTDPPRQILAPETISPPWEEEEPTRAAEASDAFESQSFRAVDAPDALDDSALSARVTSLQAAARQALKESGVSENCMWVLARALKGFAAETGVNPKLGSALAVWWAEAVGLLTPGLDFEEFLADLTDCYRRAKVPLGSNPLKAAEATLPQLPKGATYAQKMERLALLCEKLQKKNGNEPFFISVRDVGRIIGNTDRYAAQKAISYLIAKGIIEMVKKGGPETMKASRYRYTMKTYENQIQ